MDIDCSRGGETNEAERREIELRNFIHFFRAVGGDFRVVRIPNLGIRILMIRYVGTAPCPQNLYYS